MGPVDNFSVRNNLLNTWNWEVLDRLLSSPATRDIHSIGQVVMIRPKMTMCDVEVVHCLDQETADVVLSVGVDGPGDCDCVYMEKVSLARKITEVTRQTCPPYLFSYWLHWVILCSSGAGEICYRVEFDVSVFEDEAICDNSDTFILKECFSDDDEDESSTTFQNQLEGPGETHAGQSQT